VLLFSKRYAILVKNSVRRRRNPSCVAPVQMATQQETDDLARLLLSASDAEPTNAAIHPDADATDAESTARSNAPSGKPFITGSPVESCCVA